MLNWQNHKIIMVKILKNIYQDLKISPYLVFKGGTACLLFYGLPRYSIDLDFDLIKPNKSTAVYEKIADIINQYGKITDQARKKSTLLFELSYKTGERRLKIEISTRPNISSFAVLNYLGIPMQVMAKQDIFAHKLIALTRRKNLAARDVFDLHFFFSNNWDINEKIIKRITNKNLNAYLNDCLSALKKISSRNILYGLGELVDNKQKTWIKNNLKKDLEFLIRAKMER